MIVLLKKGVSKAQIEDFTGYIKSLGVDIHLSEGANTTIIGLVGDTSGIDPESFKADPIVESVKRVQEPFKRANRKFHNEDVVITLENGTKIGGGSFPVIAGPCSIESMEQMTTIAKAVKESGAQLLRGGAFKPRTSPYAFQGLHEDGINILLEAKRVTGLPIVTEIMDASQIKYFDDVDIIQVGARNMQNFELLKHLSALDKPVLLKRGLANTLQELLMSAEYVMSGGNDKVILCERGIRTFETYARNTLDISAIPILHRLSPLPVIVDPSHATGDAKLVRPMAFAAAAAGADGLIIEVHNDPARALCDGAQSLTPPAFDSLMRGIEQILPFADRSV